LGPTSKKRPLRVLPNSRATATSTCGGAGDSRQYKEAKKQPIASLKKLKAKSRRQIVEEFVSQYSKTDVVALIEKLLVAMGVSYQPDVTFDLTSVSDSPPKADTNDTATAVQALCELVGDGARQTPIEIDDPAPQIPRSCFSCCSSCCSRSRILLLAPDTNVLT
jgi:hypothetical protein